MEADGHYAGSRGRRWKVDWERTPQPVEIKLRCLRGVRDKLPGQSDVIHHEQRKWIIMVDHQQQTFQKTTSPVGSVLSNSDPLGRPEGLKEKIMAPVLLF